MELLRTLGALIEPPSPKHHRLAELLGLGPVPSDAEHTDTFLFQLYPYASVYLGLEGQLGGEARDRIAGFWRALGETPPPEPDHLALMLPFYAELRERELRGALPGEERWRHVCGAFLWEHLLSWLPIYLAKLEQVAPYYYRRWARLLLEVLSGEAERLSRPEQVSLHLRDVPSLADPRLEGATEFLNTLLSPIRSGLILVRDDLTLAGRELDLGVRTGERKYVLKALLSQSPTSTLGWLAQECRDGAELAARQASLLGPAADFWSKRAIASATLLDELSKETVAQAAVP